jgi:hypothetical protein
MGGQDSVMTSVCIFLELWLVNQAIFRFIQTTG